ncbi:MULTISPECIES: hypothetical protein [unclassified Ensifer]|uniref:hypothetical protein n=1 Tax=unclassified Ensifer TaxID=2633371 RepID=UPI000A3F2A9A|nr:MULTISPECIES: hypothetical protein [unclassified Ensifer]
MLTSDIKNTAYPLLRRAMRSLNRSLTPLKAAGGRLRYMSSESAGFYFKLR